mgnify:CR=1 FL=1
MKPFLLEWETKLEHFQDELSYILENVEGNNNYGKEFVSTVEKTFELEWSGVKQNEPVGSIFNTL